MALTMLRFIPILKTESLKHKTHYFTATLCEIPNLCARCPVRNLRPNDNHGQTHRCQERRSSNQYANQYAFDVEHLPTFHLSQAQNSEVASSEPPQTVFSRTLPWLVSTAPRVTADSLLIKGTQPAAISQIGRDHSVILEAGKRCRD